MVSASAAVEQRQIEVWLIDDNQEYTTVVAEAINLSSGAVCTATYSRCEPAFEALRKGTPAPNVLLLDIGLPGIGGIQAIETFKEFSPSMQIIMLTVYDMDEKVSSAVQRGASGYLLKTSDIDGILRAVHSTVQGGMPLDPMVTRNLIQSIRVPRPREGNTYGLTDRELQILRYLVEGYSFQEIANRMFISVWTVNTHVNRINEKLDVHSRSVAVVKALKEGLI